MAFYSWASIEGFHNVRKHTALMPEVLNGNPIVKYRTKCKLHGTNASIQIHEDGTVIAQSRERIIYPNDDNAGFAMLVHNEEALNKTWSAVATKTYCKDIIIYGEWCGKGIQRNVAISNISKKVFAVFAVRFMDENNNILIIEPDDLYRIIGDIPDTYVLPWNDKEYQIDYSKSNDELKQVVSDINDEVLAVERNDPWVEKTFGVKGTGEGIVLYPVSPEHLGYANFQNLSFKAKGEEHKNIKTAKPVEIDPAVANSIEQFADMVLTNARLEQGATAVNTNSVFDMKFVGKFIGWISSDVEKETKAELEASKLEWKQVQKTIANKARNWYLEKFKSE